MTDPAILQRAKELQAAHPAPAADPWDMASIGIAFKWGEDETVALMVNTFDLPDDTCREIYLAGLTAQ